MIMKSDIQLNSLAIKIRNKYGSGNKEPINIENVLASTPSCTLIEIPLPERISGMCIKDEGSNIIVANTNMSVGRVHFTLAHELYHMEDPHSSGQICSTNLYEPDNDIEKEANTFASFFLLPYDGLEWFHDHFHIKEWTEKECILLSQFYGISYLAVLVRLLNEKRISEESFQKLKMVNVLSLSRKMGYSAELYLPYSEGRNYRVLGEYPRLLEEKYQTGLIKDSLFKQLCRDAFIDTGEFLQGGVIND